MNTEATLPTELVQRTDQKPFHAAELKTPSLFRKGLRFFWKYFLGMLFCQSLVGGILIIGWTYRLVQRAVLKQWWRRSEP